MDEGDKSSELNFKITVEPVPDKPEFITSFDQLITLEEGVNFNNLLKHTIRMEKLLLFNLFHLFGISILGLV